MLLRNIEKILSLPDVFRPVKHRPVWVPCLAPAVSYSPIDKDYMGEKTEKGSQVTPYLNRIIGFISSVYSSIQHQTYTYRQLLKNNWFL
jgi:hypothetical protein